MNNYALDIGYKTDLKLPNGKHIALKDGDRLEFTMIDDRDEKESIVEERFYVNRLDWKDDLMYGIKYTIAESKYLDRIDKAHISPDMLINKTASREFGLLEIGILEGTNKIKISIPSGKFYNIPDALDIILIRDNLKNDTDMLSAKDKADAELLLAIDEIKDIIKRHKLDAISFKAQGLSDDEEAAITVGTVYIAEDSHKKYMNITHFAMVKELYEEN